MGNRQVNICADCLNFCRLATAAEYATYRAAKDGKDIAIKEGNVITFNALKDTVCKKCDFEIIPRLGYESGKGFTIIGSPSMNIGVIHGKCPIKKDLARIDIFITSVPNFGVVISPKFNTKRYNYLIWLDDRDAICSDVGLCQTAEINGKVTGCFYDYADGLYIINSTGDVLPFNLIILDSTSEEAYTYKIDNNAQLIITRDFKNVQYISDRPGTKTKAAIRDVALLPNS
jgi:hypothetical protein